MDEGVPVPRSEPGIQPKVLFAIVPAIGVLIYNATLMPKNGVLHVVATATFMGFALLVPTLLAYFLGRRSLRAATVTYYVVAVLLFLSQVGAYRRITGDREWEQFRAELQPILQQHHQRLEQELDGVEVTAPTEQDSRVQVTQALRRAADRMAGGPRRAVLGILTLLESMQAEVQALDVAHAELMADHPLDTPSLVSVAEIQRRTRIIDRYTAACTSFIEVMRRLPKRFRVALRTERVPERDVKGILRGFLNAGTLSRLIRLRELDLAALNTMRQVMELLEDNWGKWRFNPQTQDVDADSDELQTLLLQHLAQIQKIVDKQEALQRQGLERIGKELRTRFE